MGLSWILLHPRHAPVSRGASSESTPLLHAERKPRWTWDLVNIETVDLRMDEYADTHSNKEPEPAEWTGRVGRWLM